MKNLARKSVLSLMAVALAWAAQGCLQQNTVGDDTAISCQHGKAAANQIAAQYAPMKGQYVGAYNGSTMMLTLDVIPGGPASSTSGVCQVPQPTLAGAVSMTPPVLAKNFSGKPVMIPFAVTSGEYTGDGDLALTIQLNGASTLAHCTASDNENDLDCHWYTNASIAPSADFRLRRVKDGQALTVGTKQYDGLYRGGSQFHKEITAVFYSVEDIQGSSSAGIPLVSVRASFTIEGVTFGCKGSQYDPISNTLVMEINGTNPIQVDCVVKSSESVHCIWDGGNVANSREEFELTKSE